MGWRDLFSSDARRRREAATAVALESGMLQRCPVCREVTDKLPAGALEIETGRLAEHLMAERDPRLAPFDGNLELFQRTLREVRGRATFDCRCERG